MFDVRANAFSPGFAMVYSPFMFVFAAAALTIATAIASIVVLTI